MTAKDTALAQIEMVARVHRLYKPIMELALQNSLTTEHGKEISGNNNLYEGWKSSYGDKYFNMTSIVRLSSEIELFFKSYYVERKGYPNLSKLKNDPKAKSLGIFQRVEKSKSSSVVELFESEFSIFLSSISHFIVIREMFVLRHLYAHRVGVIDDRFLDEYRTVTGTNLKLNSEILRAGYPNKDVIWFVDDAFVSRLISASQAFVKALP